MKNMDLLQTYVRGLSLALEGLQLEQVDKLATLFQDARARRAQIFVIGNGGSAAAASHMMCDLNKTTISRDGPRLRVISLTDDVPSLTAWANDTSFENVFAEQLENLAAPQDLLLAISTSGRSPNILRALERARKIGMITLGLTGRNGGNMKDLVDHCVYVETDSTGQVEDVHNVINHMLTACMRGAISW